MPRYPSPRRFLHVGLGVSWVPLESTSFVLTRRAAGVLIPSPPLHVTLPPPLTNYKSFAGDFPSRYVVRHMPSQAQITKVAASVERVEAAVERVEAAVERVEAAVERADFKADLALRRLGLLLPLDQAGLILSKVCRWPGAPKAPTSMVQRVTADAIDTLLTGAVHSPPTLDPNALPSGVTSETVLEVLQYLEPHLSDESIAARHSIAHPVCDVANMLTESLDAVERVPTADRPAQFALVKLLAACAADSDVSPALTARMDDLARTYSLL